jgi:hypothetical protein
VHVEAVLAKNVSGDWADGGDSGVSKGLAGDECEKVFHSGGRGEGDPVWRGSEHFGGVCRCVFRNGVAVGGDDIDCSATFPQSFG